MSHHWDYHPVALSLNQVPPTHLCTQVYLRVTDLKMSCKDLMLTMLQGTWIAALVTATE